MPTGCISQVLCRRCWSCEIRHRTCACCDGLRFQNFLMLLAGHFGTNHRGHICFQNKGDHEKSNTLVFEQRYVPQILLLCELNRPNGAVNLTLVEPCDPVAQLLRRDHKSLLDATKHIATWPKGYDGTLADQTDANLQGHAISTRRHLGNHVLSPLQGVGRGWCSEANG